MSDVTPDIKRRLAVCQHPDGGDYIPLRDDEPEPATCFMECGCVPRIYVPADVEWSEMVAYWQTRVEALTVEIERQRKVLRSYGYAS